MTDDKIKAMLQEFGFHNGPGPYMASGSLQNFRALIEMYEEVLADHRRLVRELDVAMHGEEGAAKQASLCDLIEPARKMPSWKPISQAPKHNMSILCGHAAWTDEAAWCRRDRNGLWYEGRAIVYPQPTHFLHVPHAPAILAAPAKA